MICRFLPAVFRCLMLAGGLLSADLACTGLFCNTAHAQVDPFAPAGADDPFAPAGEDEGFDVGFGDGQGDAFGAPVGAPFGAAGTTAPVAAAADAADEVRDPLILELRRYAQGTPDQLAVAIREATRIGAWREVDDFLTVLAGRQLGAPALARAADRIGGPLLARLKIQPALSAASQAQVDALRVAAKAVAEDLARVRTAVGQIDSSDVNQRAAAYRILLAGGDISIAELVRAAAQPKPPVSRRSIAEVLMTLGEGSQAALEQLAVYGSDELRAGALATLALLGRSEALDSLVSALHAAEASEAERAVAASHLKEMYPALPSATEAEIYLLQSLKKADRQAARTPNTELTTSVWTIAEDRQSVAPQILPERLAALHRATTASARLSRLASMNPDSRAAVLASDLEYRVQRDPMFGGEADRQTLQGAWGEQALSATALEDLLVQTLRQERHAAAVGVLRLLPADPQLVISYSDQPTPLVAAASHSNARVRYEAVLAIARAPVDQPYAGSSVVLHRLVEMARLKDRPTALVVEPRLTAANRLETMLVAYGYRVETLRTVRQAVQRIEQGGDVQVIVATTQLPDLPPIELVDRIRRRSLGRDVPIIFFGEQRAGTETSRFEAPVRRIHPPVETLEQIRNDVLRSAMELISQDLRFVLHQPALETPRPRRDEDLEQRARYSAALDQVRSEVRQGFGERNFNYFGTLLGFEESPIAVVLQPEAEDYEQVELSPLAQLRELFASMGFAFESVSSLEAMRTRLDGSRPVHLLFLPASAVPDQASSLVEGLRQHPRARDLPIFFFGSPTAGLEGPKFVPVVRRRASLEEPQTFGTVMQEILEAASMSPLAPDERRQYGNQSLEILGHIAGEPALSFYDLRSSGVESVLTTSSPGSSEASLAVLSGLGTPSSQASLAGLAASPSLSQAARLQAADAFARSIQQFGTRLSRESVAMQYHRYNRAADPDVRSAIGKLLDAMELRAGAASAEATRPPADPSSVEASDTENE